MKQIILSVTLLCSSFLFSQKTPLQILPSGHLLVKAKIEGKEGNFIFDTGGGINLFFNDFAKNLKQKSTYNFFTGFRATGERLDIPLFKSDEILFADKQFQNIPYATFDMKMNGIDGLISLPMFQNTDFIIDFDKQELTLTEFKTNEKRKYFDIQFATNADNSLDIFTDILLNNEFKIRVLLDSGAGNDSFWLSDKLISTLKIDQSKLEMSEKKSEFNLNITNKFYRGTIHSISNDFAQVKEPKVVFVEGLIYEGKTSINWLGKKIGISLKQKKIFILD